MWSWIETTASAGTLATVCAHVRVRVREVGGDGADPGRRRWGRRTASLSRGCLGLAHGDR